MDRMGWRYSVIDATTPRYRDVFVGVGDNHDEYSMWLVCIYFFTDYDHASPEHAGQFHHVELYASDFEVSAEFWDWLLTNHLEYKLKNEWDGGCSWVNEPTYIVLVQADNPDHHFDRQAPGLNHLAFHATSREQVDEITVGIREREDATVLYEDQHPYAGGYYALYCEGPEGIKVEIVGPE